MKELLRKMLVVLLVLPFILPGSQQKGLDYNFIQNNNYYSFQGSFIVPAEFDCLIHVIYDFEHISKYTSGAKSIDIIRKGENWYEVTYTYRKLIIFENQSTWRRTLKLDEGKIVFEMISSKNNLNIMPDVLSSTGYYQVKPAKEGHRVEYFQECKLKPGILKNTYISHAKKEAIKFLRGFKEYIEKTCN